METAALLSKISALGPGVLLENRRFGRSQELSVWIEARAIPRVTALLRYDPELQLDWLENLSVIQLDDTFVITYFLRSTSSAERAIVRASVVPPSVFAPVTIASVKEVWGMAKGFEDEISELFGFDFGSSIEPGTGKLIAGWSGYPLRKNYVFPKDVGQIAHARASGHAHSAPTVEQEADALDVADHARGLE